MAVGVAPALTSVRARRGAFLSVAPNDFTHLHVHSEFSLLDGLGAHQRPRHAGQDAWLRLARHHRPRRAVRRRRLLPGVPDGRHQADHRRRDVRRAAVDDRPRGQGRRQAVPPDPARARLDRLPEPVPPRHRRASRRLLLQAAHRSRLPGQALGGPDRAVGVSRWRGRSRRSRPASGTRRAASPAPTSDILGKGNFFLELQDHGMPEQRRLNEQLLRLSPETGIPLVVTNDLHYVRRAAGGGARRAALRRHGVEPRHARPHEVRRRRTST